MAQRSDGGADLLETDLLETGVPGLDRILGGGIRTRATVMVIGAPGLGKTILAQQIAFHRAARGGAALYLTGYSETHDKLISNARGLSFFAAERIGQQMQFGSLPDLLRNGPDQTEDAIVATARAQRASLVVLDGFRSIRGFLADDHVAAGFLYSLGGKLALLGATTLVVVEGNPDDTAGYPELTVCDVILSLRRSRRGSHSRRLAEVLKTRGSRLLDGTHPFVIDDNGVSIFPRFETIVPTAEQQAWTPRLSPVGIPELDALLGGGLSAGTATLTAGSPGVGKTTLGLHFLAAGIRAGEPGLLLGFMESAAQLREKARLFGMDLAAAEADGRLRFLLLPGYDLEADYIATLLREDIERRGVRRLVIDSAKELERAVDSTERVPDFIAALVSYLRGQEVTTYLTLDIPRIMGTELDFAETPLSVVAENLLVLRQVEYRGALHRVCAVFKMRFSNHDRGLHEYTITVGEGIRILGPAPVGEGLLTGIARPLIDIPLQNPASGS